MGNTEESIQTEDTQQTNQEPEPANPPENPGGPDAAKAAEGYRKQRDEARREMAKRQKAESAAKEAEYRRVNSVRLIKEGCVDVEVALTLLDENGDVDTLKKEKPYLFGSASKGSTGLKPNGSAAADKFAAIDKAMGLEPLK